MTHPLRAPAELSHIADVIGVEATLRLVEELGGTEVYVARDVKPTSPLAVAIGAEAAQQLARAVASQHHAAWATGYLRVPLARAWRIHAYAAQGLTNTAIARRMGMTQSGVWRALRGAPSGGRRREHAADTSQRDLFGG